MKEVKEGSIKLKAMICRHIASAIMANLSIAHIAVMNDRLKEVSE